MIWLIGAGVMAIEYAKVLNTFAKRNDCYCRNKESLYKFKDMFGFRTEHESLAS